VRVPIRRAMYIIVIVTLGVSYLTLVILTVVTVHWAVGGLFCTAFAYAMGLSVLVAREQSAPYGLGLAQLNQDEDFSTLEVAYKSNELIPYVSPQLLLEFA
jgi:hypothetical protein